MNVKRFIRVAGNVQGVGFRMWTQRTARRLGLHGWVRNFPDGTVHLAAEGDPSSLDELIDLLYEGPPASEVLSVESWVFEESPLELRSEEIVLNAQMTSDFPILS